MDFPNCLWFNKYSQRKYLERLQKTERITMQPINPISFNGTLIRQTKVIIDKKPPHKAKVVESTRSDILASYNREISKIEAYKQFSIKLDYLMYEDKDIQEKIQSLPEDMEIEVAAQLSKKEGSIYEIELEDPMLIAENNQGKSCAIDVKYNEKGPDKKEILGWLNNVEKILN